MFPTNSIVSLTFRRAVSIALRLTLAVASLSVSEALAESSALTIRDKDNTNNAVQFWLASSLERVFPQTKPGSTNLTVLAARNSRVAFQVAFRNERSKQVFLKCAVSEAADLKPQVRWVGLTPMHHFTPDTAPEELDGITYGPGLFPDPLWPVSDIESGPFATRSFWVTLNVPAKAKPGRRTVKVQVTPRGQAPITLPLTLEIGELVVQPRKDFPVIHWWRGEATWDFYKTGMFDERWWSLTRGQMENMLAHGSDVVYVPIFFDRRETFKRPCQLLIVNEPKPGVYEFDWSRVKQFTDMCKEIGFKQFEWSHIWIYWGVENPIRLYTKKGDDFVMLWPPDTGATSETYLNFLRQFLPQFHDFLAKEKILDASYFHLSDEPGSDKHVENYRRARQVLRDLAPWMKVMDALSDIRYGKEGLTDMPIPMVDAAQAYIDAKIPHWVYYCCAPHGPWVNRFIDTPLPKTRMAGWLFYKHGARGFLHWGYNYWHRIETEQITDPFTEAAAAAYPAIPYGDPFVIYPGPNGPIDSIRWEVFAESLQDYAILQSAGVKPTDPMLAPLKSYADFPKNKEWIQQALRKIIRVPESGD
jgi:hypothetical protein